jgi:hypothetical protein
MGACADTDEHAMSKRENEKGKKKGKKKKKKKKKTHFLSVCEENTTHDIERRMRLSALLFLVNIGFALTSNSMTNSTSTSTTEIEDTSTSSSSSVVVDTVTTPSNPQQPTTLSTTPRQTRLSKSTFASATALWSPPLSTDDACSARLGAVAVYKNICLDVTTHDHDAYCRCFQTMLREAVLFGCQETVVQFYRDGCVAHHCSSCVDDGASDSGVFALAPSTVIMLGVVIALALCALIVACVLLVQKRRRYDLVAQFNPIGARHAAAVAAAAAAAAAEAPAPARNAAADDAEPAQYPPVYTSY